MANQMQECEARSPPVEHRNRQSGSPTARSLGIFLKKTGLMGGGDSPCYYWGNVMLEKMRIFNKEKKSKASLETEQK